MEEGSARPYLVAQEAVDVDRALGGVAVDHAQGGKGDAVPVQAFDGGHHPGVRRLTALAVTMAVVQLGWAVDRQPDEEILGLEEGAPFIVEQRTVGLQIILNRLLGFFVFGLDFNDAAEKIQPHQRGFTALPAKYHFVASLRFDILPNMRFEQKFAHSRHFRLMQ